MDNNYGLVLMYQEERNRKKISLINLVNTVSLHGGRKRKDSLW